MKITELLFRLIIMAVLPVFFLTLALAIAFNSQWLYQYGFEKYDITSVTGLEEIQLDLASRQLIEYFNSDQQFIDIVVEKNNQPFELFNQKEILHLADVKGLVQLDYAVLAATGLFITGSAAVYLTRRSWRRLIRAAAWGSGLSVLAIGFIGVLALMDFNWLFTQFHLLSFANDLWLLDPSKDYLIMMFPEGFWFDAALFCGLLVVVLSIFTAVGSLVLARYRPGPEG